MTQSLPSLCVAPSVSLRHALEVMNAGGVAIALVIDAEDVLLGTLTDGDVRRALVAGAHLEGVIEGMYRRDFIAVGPGAERAAVLELMQARGISHVPVVDAGGHLRGLHLLRELVGAAERPNASVIMAGGRGTRLRPYTLSTPKPMVRVAGRPILERLVLHLVGSGIRRIYLSVNYMADVIEAHFRDGDAFGCEISYLRESPEQPLGTGGALALLPASVRQSPLPLLVLNGDLMTNFSVAGMLASHEENSNSVTVGVSEYVHQVPFGVARVEGDRLQGIDEKPIASWLVNSGIYVLEPRLISQVKPGVDFPITLLLATSIASSERVGTYRLDDEWRDIGAPPDLRKARGEP